MLKQIGIIIAFILGIVLGFIVKGFLPSGPPPMGMMGMGGEMPPPAVKAVELHAEPLDVLDEYIATVEPVQQVWVKTEVSGYLDAVHFREGSMVKEGDLLFTVDQKRYRAMVEAREADLASAKAELNRAEKYLERINSAGEGTVSQSDKDRAIALQLQGVANLKQAEANLNMARLDLEYSEIRSPINGRIGAAMVTKGNYIDPMMGDLLAQIVQLDPVRVVFSMTDRAYLNFREKAVSGESDELAAQVRLPNGTVLPMIGKKDFDDNMMNSGTGTMAVRYLFENPDEMLVAGGYVTALLRKSDRPMGIRVPQQAILVDPDGNYVLTVNEDGLVGKAPITLGDAVEDDYVVLSGLNANDRVVIEGVQKVQPGMTAMVTLQEAAQ